MNPGTLRHAFRAPWAVVLVVVGVVGCSLAPTTESVELTATDEVLRAQCQNAADLLGFQVPCPSALPATNEPVRCQTPSDFAGADIIPREGCALGAGFILAPSSMVDPDIFHLVIAGAKTALEDCGGDDPQTPIELNGLDAAVIQCNELAGLVAGHTLVRYQTDGGFVEVSVHGHTDHDRRIVVAIGESIEMIAPS